MLMLFVDLHRLTYARNNALRERARKRMMFQQVINARPATLSLSLSLSLFLFLFLYIVIRGIEKESNKNRLRSCCERKTNGFPEYQSSLAKL